MSKNFRYLDDLIHSGVKDIILDSDIVLDDGESVGMGTHTELLENCEVYREIYDSQFKQEERGQVNG